MNPRRGSTSLAERKKNYNPTPAGLHMVVEHPRLFPNGCVTPLGSG